MQGLEQISQAPRGRVRIALGGSVALDGRQLLRHTCLQVAGLVEVPAAEAQLDHRVAHRPVPAVIGIEPSEQLRLPSNSSFSVSRNRLLPKRRGRDRK